MKHRRIVAYTVVNTFNDIIEFENGVNLKINDGWQPFGSMTVVQSDDTMNETFFQAMVKYEEGER